MTITTTIRSLNDYDRAARFDENNPECTGEYDEVSYVIGNRNFVRSKSLMVSNNRFFRSWLARPSEEFQRKAELVIKRKVMPRKDTKAIHNRNV